MPNDDTIWIVRDRNLFNGVGVQDGVQDVILYPDFSPIFSRFGCVRRLPYRPDITVGKISQENFDVVKDFGETKCKRSKERRR